MAKKVFLNQRGSQIVQMLVATVILTSTALAVFNMFVTNKSISVRVAQKSSCQSYIDSSFARIAAMGIRIQAQRAPVPSDPDYPRWVDGAPVEPGIQGAHRWPDDNAFDILLDIPNNRNPIEHQTPWLIQGAINGLLAIYNTAPNFCTGGNNYMPLLPEQAQQGMSGVTASIQIEPYNLDDRADAGCPLAVGATPLMIAPPSGLATGGVPATDASFGPEANSPPNDVAEKFSNLPNANIRDDLGLLATVTVNYIDVQGNPMTCSGQARYEYPTDSTPPAEMRLPYMVMNNTTDAVPFIALGSDDGGGPGPPDVYDAYRELGVRNHPDTSAAAAAAYNRDYKAAKDTPLLAGGSWGKTYDFGDLHLLTDTTTCQPGTGPVLDRPDPDGPGGINPESDTYLDFGYMVTDLEPGSIVLCRDVSRMFSPSLNTAYCIDGGTHYARKDCAEISVDGTTCINPNPGYDRFKNNTGWVPCEDVEACRRKPHDPTSLAPDTSIPNRVRFQNNYKGVPLGCEVRIEMAVVDTAGNARVNLISHRKEADCGPYCGTTAPAYPDGYFYCGGCPAVPPPAPGTTDGVWSDLILTEPCGGGAGEPACATTCPADPPPLGGPCTVAGGFGQGVTCSVDNGDSSIDLYLCM